MRVLGLDYGDVRIGVAISDPLGWTAQGLATISRKNPIDLVESIAKIVEIAVEQQVKTIVLGLPKNMDNSEGASCEKVRKFRVKLEKALRNAGLHPVEVTFFDERLTTAMAERLFSDAAMPANERRKHVDKTAAILILQGYLDMAANQNNNQNYKNTTHSCDKENNMDLENTNNFDENDDLGLDDDMIEVETIVMTDEDGNEVEYVIIDEFIHTDVNYLVMVKAENAEDDEAEAVIFKQVEASDDEFVYEEIDEDEYNNLEPVLKARLSEFDIDIQ